ncbi:two-component sensor histidine kinase [Paenibacillus agaridevorans]|uniref:Two-component sensor histidine kinase n=1 Tax=Paenibacillus agaridevorans TaxID=171404 RepID=A0A2R5EUZ7_9BACL|nr:sensor histidine kinase [Paenibacillus agaridevorans]GBG10522.1 two-component sensor histidine kinase [Paenibacillus agaridevorans]
MKRRFPKLWPTKLRNRIFLTFLLVVFVPFSLLQIRNYNQIESVIGEKISQQNSTQLSLMKTKLEEVRWTAQYSVLQMEREADLLKLLANSRSLNQVERAQTIEEKLAALKSSYLPNSVYIQYTLESDGLSFTTFPLQGSDREKADVRAQLASKLREELPLDGPLMRWEQEAALNWIGEEHREKLMLSYYSLSNDKSEEGLRLRAAIDAEQWLRDSANSMQIKQNYYLVDEFGAVKAQTNAGYVLRGELAAKLKQLAGQGADSYYIDSSGTYVYNAVYIPSVNMYVAAQFPLDFFIGDLQSLKRQIFYTFLIVALIFAAISFLTLSNMTRPLRLLEIRMKEAADKRLNIKLSEGRHKGEVLSFVRAFNGMIDDISRLIGQLKAEERQKEAAQFQMLLTQMNPHFLLNTMNTIKWSASNFGDEKTAEMCKALAKLLESSLNTDTDLVFLKDELELLRAYCYIQSFRYDHRFEVRYEVDEELDYALMLKLSLQPLVENAIQHGLVYRKQGGVIIVRAIRDERLLVLEVEDNGAAANRPKRPSSARTRKGIGLSNLRERLSLLYREDGRLELKQQEEGMLVRMTIPLLVSNPYQSEMEE